MIGFFAGVYHVLGGDWNRISMLYIAPLLVFNAWITLVTYLQVRLSLRASEHSGYTGCIAVADVEFPLPDSHRPLSVSMRPLL